MPLVLVENERTVGGRYDSWQDLTGSCYHFPNAYRNLVQPGERFVYYRGVRQKEGKRRPQPEYFGCGVIDEVWRDAATYNVASKRDWKWFCSIAQFTRFPDPVSWRRNSGETLEPIPKNLFGNGVRRISNDLFAEIIVRAQLILERPKPINPSVLVLGDEERIRAFLQLPAANGPAERASSAVSRLIRDTPLVRMMKQLYSNTCQICRKSLSLRGGRQYSEGHHIKPLGRPHHGPDSAQNILILCPNHHVLCDFFALTLEPAALLIHPLHKIGNDYIDYYNALVTATLKRDPAYD